MTLRLRLTLWFTGIASALLALFCVVIYVVTEQYRAGEFRERLRAEAITCAELLYGRETISPELYRLLDKNHLTVLNEEEIIVYDYQNKRIFESGTDYLNVSKALLDRVRLRQDVHWHEGEREIVGAYFADRFNRLVIFASAVDKYGFSKQRNLAWLLAVGWLVAVAVVFGAGRVYAERALRPLRAMIGRVDAITAAQLSLRLDVGPEQDEIGQLADRFNQMLDRIEDAFRQQRAFVSHASHELRTPLTAITGQLEASLLADDSAEELRETVRSVLDDVRGLNRLANGLLSLANMGVDETAVRFTNVAIDELLWRVRADVTRARRNATVRVTLDGGDAPDWTLRGSEALLYTALLNLVENAIKFSPDAQADVALRAEPRQLSVAVHNDGPPIPAEELPHIFQPFKRAQNAQGVAGHGVGLSLTERIVRLHGGRLTVESAEGAGTTFTLVLRR